VVVDCVGLDRIIGRQVGKRKLEQIPVSEALPDHPINGGTNLQTNVISVPEKECREPKSDLPSRMQKIRSY
jgi:hypothetical protein